MTPLLEDHSLLEENPLLRSPICSSSTTALISKKHFITTISHTTIPSWPSSFILHLLTSITSPRLQNVRYCSPRPYWFPILRVKHSLSIAMICLLLWVIGYILFLCKKNIYFGWAYNLWTCMLWSQLGHHYELGNSSLWGEQTMVHGFTTSLSMAHLLQVGV